MNTKKLIGTIIGVALFAALVAGATFAWLSFSATVQNATKTFTSRNFTFTSPTGTNITALRFLSGSPVRNTFTGGSDYVALSLSKGANTPYASSVKLMLKKPTNEFTVANALKYAVCRSSTAADCDNQAATAIPSATSNSNWVVVNGSITTGTADQVLFEDLATATDGPFTITSTTGSPFAVTGAASTVYYIYFWVDPSVVQDVTDINNKTLSGNVFFTATQGE